MRVFAAQFTDKNRASTKHESALRHSLSTRLAFPSTTHNSGAFLQRKPNCACGGDCPSCATELDSDPSIQAKLIVGEAHDEYEKEADQVADYVVGSSGTSHPPHSDASLGHETYDPSPVRITPAVNAATYRMQRQPETPDQAETEEEELEDQAAIVQTKRAEGCAHETKAQNAFLPALSVEQNLNRTKGGGLPLPVSTRTFMEDRFDVDLGQVRVHDDSNANQLNRLLHSYAFTTGSDIYFATGMYRPGTIDGNRLLAHELTHVLQQTGGVRLQRAKSEGDLLVQRAFDEEEKWYTGTQAHNLIEDRLETKYSSLITEAPIPGGTSHGEELNLTGFADLYMSDGQVVSGVQGFYPGSDKSKPLEYKNMPKAATSSRFSKWGRLHSKSPIQHGPRLGKKTGGVRAWDTTPDFPANFQVGEIKPLGGLSGGLVGLGLSQLSHYIRGFEAFVKKVRADSGVTRTSTSGAKLNIDLPDAIDYAKFDTEHLNPGSGAIIMKSRPKDKRLWAYRMPDAGLYLYFDLPHPYAPATYPKSIDEKLKGLDPLLKDLRKKHPNIAGKLMVSKKARPDMPASQTQPQHIQRRIKRDALLIQRDAKPGAVDWDKLGKAWEQRRKSWDQGPRGARAFLEGEGKGPAERQKIDKALNLPASSNKGPVKDEPIKIKRIELWSGQTGKVLGYLRFKLGSVFDKIAGFFDKVRKRFEGWHKKSNQIAPKGGISITWTQTAKKIILKFAVKIFKEFLVFGFNAFATCANGMINKVVNRYVEEASEELKEEMEWAHSKLDSLQQELLDKFGIHEKDIDQFVDAVDEINQWTRILAAVETGIRVGVQVVSCVSPPGLGCLWGLVAQLSIGPALDLLTSTDYFEDNIARPAARELMDSIAGDALRGLVAETVQAVGLGKYAEGVDACVPRKRLDAGGGGSWTGFNPNSPSLKKARDQWQKQYHNQIVEDLLKKFEQGATGAGEPAKPVTEADLLKLIEEMKQSKLTPEEMKQALERAENKNTRKINLSVATAELRQGAAAAVSDVARGEGKAAVIDATTAGEKLPSDLKVSPNFTIQIRSESGHTQGARVLITVDVFEKNKYLVTVVNLPAEVVSRVWHDETKKTYLKITYKLSKPVALAPFADGKYLTGSDDGKVVGYLKYGNEAPTPIVKQKD